MTHITPELLRRAFSESIAAEVAQFDRVEPRFLHRPTVHLRALDPQATLVAGMRGAGKSFWWHALQDPALRALALPTSANRSTASAGFGEGDAADRPGQDVMEQLFAQGYPPKLIWKAVVLRHALAAAAFRGLTERPWTRRGNAGYEVPDELRQNERAQSLVFTALAGPHMGTNHRRGRTYPWLPSHISDAHGAVSPRSFLAALRQAAQQTKADAPSALHWTAIQDGVRKASQVRTTEIGEDLPWAEAALARLRDVVVPCPREDVLLLWRGGVTGLEPSQVLDGLRDVGILAELPDGRINVPDLFRVGLGLRRKGGLAPASEASTSG